MARAVQIGQYCSDFIIVDPVAQDSEDGFYYSRKEADTNREFYLCITPVGVTEVESPIEAIGHGYVDKDFRIRLHWDRSIRPVVNATTSVVEGPIDTLRYLSSKGEPTPGTSVVLKYDGSSSLTLRTSSTATTLPKTIVTFRNTASTALVYTRTTSPPMSVTRDNTLKFLLRTDDTTAVPVTTATTKRYLLIVPSSPNTGLDLNLYTPRVTEDMIKQTGYRINQKSTLSGCPPEIAGTYWSVDVFRQEFGIASTGSSMNYRELSNFTSISTSSVTYSGISYTVTTALDDKTISDLYGDLSLGLFKLYLNDAETNLHLGYDCQTPSTSCGNPKLILREYYNFFNPVNSAQFRLYDLGNNEYMILVTDPLITPPKRYMMKPSSSGALQFITVTAVKEERGWHLERVDAAANTVRIRWNYPESPVLGAWSSPGAPQANYIQFTSTTSGSVASMSAFETSAVFTCIKCSRVNEETGTCAPNSPIYVDEDMNYATSPILVTPTAINQAALSPVMMGATFKLAKGAGNNMTVSDDGNVTFGGAGSDFFSTRTGIITYTQRGQGVVFIGTRTSTGQYIYAKYTAPGTIKFVAATNPNVTDGFGWIMGTNTITWVSPDSPTPSSPISLLGIDIIIRSFSVSLGTYDAQNDRYQLSFTMVKQPLTVTFSSFSITSGEGSLTSTSGTGTRSASASIEATRSSSPINCVNGSPSPNPARQTTRSVRITATLSDGTNDSVTINIPEGPCPEIIATPPPPGATAITSTSASFSGFNVSNMDTTGPVTITLRAIGSPGSSTPSFTYSPALQYGSGNFTLSGLVRNTRYDRPSFLFMNTRSKKQVGVTLAAGFQTTDRVDIPAAPAGGTLQKRFYGSTTSTATSDGSTGTTSVANNQLNLPAVQTANAQLQAITGGAFKVLSFTSSTNGMKTGIPTSSARNKLTLAFVFRMNAAPTQDNWNGAFQIFQNQTWAQDSVHIALYNDRGNIKVVIAVNGGEFSGSILGTDSNNWTPFGSLTINTRYTLVVSLDSNTKNCIARLNGGSDQTISLDSRAVVAPRSSRNFLSGDSSIILGCTAESTRKFDGNIGEFIMYDNAALTSVQMQQIETYVNSNYVDPASSAPPPAVGGGGGSSQSSVSRFAYQGQVSDSSSGSGPYLSGGTTTHIRIEKSGDRNYVVFLNASNDSGNSVTSGGTRLIPNNFAGKYLFFRGITGTTVVARVDNQQPQGSPHYLDVTFINDSNQSVLQTLSDGDIKLSASNTVEYGTFS